MKTMRLYIILIFVFNFCLAQKSQVKISLMAINNKTDRVYIKDKNEIVREIKVKGVGLFEDVFEAQEGFYQIYYNQSYTEIYLKSGFNLKIKVDADDFDATIRYTGVGYSENNFIAEQINEDNTISNDVVFELNEEGFENFLIEKQATKTAELLRRGFSEKFTKLEQKNIEMSIVKLRESYNQQRLMPKSYSMK